MNIREIKSEISRLEKEDTTYSNCSKLAVLYNVIERLDQDKPEPVRTPQYSYAESEFLSVVAQAPIDEVMQIMNEHMEAIQLLYPKEYASIIRKIKELNM